MIYDNSGTSLENAYKRAKKAANCYPSAPWCVYTRLYALSTEITESFLSQLNFENKKILTVGSSGDQVLAYALLGSKDITLMDANVLTPFLLKLKLAALKVLTLDEFISFFEQFNNKEFMSLKIYAKIRTQLDENVKFFWDKLYDEGIQNKIFHFDREISNYSPPLYLTNEENYEKLKSIIDDVKISFFPAELSNFSDFTEGEYDLIDLSNIYTYVSKEKYWDAIKKLYPHLSKDGFLKFHYGELHILNGFNFFDKPPFFMPVPGVDKRGFIFWQNDERLYNLKHRKKL